MNYRKYSGICKVHVSEKDAIAEVYYESESLGVDQIELAVQKAGYEVGLNDKSLGFQETSLIMRIYFMQE